MAVGKFITWKKGEQYNLLYKGCWEEYQVRKRERGRKYLGRKSRFIKVGMGKNIKF